MKKMVGEQLIPHLEPEEPSDPRSGWEGFLRKYLPWVDSHNKEENIGVETSTESFAVSINNEFNHYKRAILGLVGPSENPEMRNQLEALEVCFKDLLTGHFP